GRRASSVRRRCSGRGAGALTSEDAGMSTRYGGEDPPHRKPKGSGARVIRSGSAGRYVEGESRRRWETGQDSRAGLGALSGGRPRKRSHGGGMVVPMQRRTIVRRRAGRRGAAGRRERSLGSPPRVVELHAEKRPGRECTVRPDRKPTQVGEARSLRY